MVQDYDSFNIFCVTTCIYFQIKKKNRKSDADTETKQRREERRRLTKLGVNKNTEARVRLAAS